MAHRRNFRSSFRGGQRRKKTWVQALQPADGPGGSLQLTPFLQQIQLTPVAADTYLRVADVFTPGSPSENGIPTESTVLRIRGQVEVAKSTLAGGDDQLFAFGICVIDLPSFPTSTDDLPGPMSAPEWDGWMFIRGPSLFGPLDVNATAYDVKAMRKIEGGQRLAFIQEAYSQDGTAIMSGTNFSARVLLALP